MPSSNDLWVGKKHSGKTTLFHGVSNYDQSYEGAFERASRIISSGNITPYELRDARPRTDITTLINIRKSVFQLYLSTLKSTDYTGEVSNGRVDLQSFALKNQSTLQEHLGLQAQEFTALLENRFINLNFQIRFRSDTGRDLTNWFSKEITRLYGEHISFKFELTAEQIAELDRNSASGNAFYKNSEYVICHQEIPLRYCSELIVSPEVWARNKLEIIKLLNENGLDHIRIRNHENNFNPDYVNALLSTDEFDNGIFHSRLNSNLREKISEIIEDKDFFENKEYTGLTECSHSRVLFIKLATYIYIAHDLSPDEKINLFAAIKSAARTHEVRSRVERLEQRCLIRYAESNVSSVLLPVLRLGYLGQAPIINTGEMVDTCEFEGCSVNRLV